MAPPPWLTGLLVYSAYDGRFGRLPFTLPGEWINIHGTVGVVLWPLALLFVFYAITAGRARLRQPANSLVLLALALALAVASGKLMDEDWLRDGQLHQVVYGVHLLAWLLIALAIALHVGSVLRRGGLPLARSMASFQVSTGDLPGNWFDQIRRSFKFNR